MKKESQVEGLYEQYVSETSTVKKERVLSKIMKCYENWGKSLAYNYAQAFPSHEQDDWNLLVQIGIWEGVEKATSPDNVRKSIYYRVRHQISKEIQLITASKRTYFHEVPYDNLNFGGEEENFWVSKMDIQAAVELLPEKTRTVVKLWMDGLPVLSCAWNEVPVEPCICKEVGLKDAAVYFRLQEGFELLRRSLKGYESYVYE
jgi:hypothetical protein